MITYWNITIGKEWENILIINLTNKPKYERETDYIKDIIDESYKMRSIYNIVDSLLSFWYTMSTNPMNPLSWIRFDWKNKLMKHPVEIFLDSM